MGRLRDLQYIFAVIYETLCIQRRDRHARKENFSKEGAGKILEV